MPRAVASKVPTTASSQNVAPSPAMGMGARAHTANVQVWPANGTGTRWMWRGGSAAFKCTHAGEPPAALPAPHAPEWIEPAQAPAAEALPQHAGDAEPAPAAAATTAPNAVA